MIKGDATYSGSGKTITWAAGGDDVYYRGTSKQELPVGVSMTYLLDGKEISAADLAGKSGKLTIKIKYTNSTKQEVEVDGKKMQMSVPFMMVSGLMLSNDHCSNVTVDNGMVENDGDHSIVLCYGLPGLSDSLALEGTDDFEEPRFTDTVEITADVTDFTMETAITVASAGLLNDVDLDNVDTLDELEDSLDDLTDAAQQLLDGTEDLLDGVDELKDGAKELQSGTGELQSGAAQLQSGAGELQSGASQVDSGAGELQSAPGPL